MRIVRVLTSLKFLIIFFTASACAQNENLAGIGGASENIAVIISATGEHRFRVELADDNEERRVGLMYRTEMAPDAGMLFDFGEPQPVSMWMKNTLIPLDMAFIDENGVIQRIAADTTPRSLESIPSGALVTAVLEVNGGVFEALGIKAGDKVRHPIFISD
jgi:hypothetical protein